MERREKEQKDDHEDQRVSEGNEIEKHNRRKWKVIDQPKRKKRRK